MLRQTLLALALLGSPTLAAEIRVPADQPTLAAAIAAASPGDTIRVQTTAA